MDINIQSLTILEIDMKNKSGIYDLEKSIKIEAQCFMRSGQVW